MGLVMLALSAVTILTGPASWLTLGAVAGATILVARDGRVGWLGAGLAVAMALPYGRGADVVGLEVAGLPLRPADVAIALALVGAVFGRRASTLRPWHEAERVAAGGVVLLLATGIFALGVGLLDGHALRDVGRDIRFWGLYAVGLVALLRREHPNALLRGLLLGSVAFCIIVITATFLPAFSDGLKDQVLTYDRGTLRMQFGNSVFLLPFLAYALARFLRKPTALQAAWVFLPIAAVGLSLTRMSMAAAALVILLVTLMWMRRHRRRGGVVMRRVGALAATIVFALAVGLSAASVAQSSDSHYADDDQQPENVLDRITGQSDQSDMDAILTSRTGRIATYLNAYGVITRHLPLGGGLGQLVPTPYAYSEARAARIGWSPGVDNAYLTFGVKAGILGIAAIGALLLVPLWTAVRHAPAHLQSWFVPAWVGILALTLTQAFASSGYSPYALALLAVMPALLVGRRSVQRVRGGSAPTATRT